MENFQDVNAGYRASALDRLQQMAQQRAAYNQRMLRKAEKRYNEYIAEARRREEEARAAAGGSWFNNIFKGGIGGAMMGGMASLMIPGVGPAAIGMGALGGAAMGGLSKATGTQDFMYGQAMPMAMQGMTTYGIGQMMRAPNAGAAGNIPGTNMPSVRTALVAGNSPWRTSYGLNESEFLDPNFVRDVIAPSSPTYPKF